MESSTASKKRMVMKESNATELHYAFMAFDAEFERLQADRTREGQCKLHLYLSKKHDALLASLFKPGTYKNKVSLAIIDGFSVEITDDQAKLLRSANGVRAVEKNQELVP